MIYWKFVIKCFTFKIVIVPNFIILGGNVSGLIFKIVIMSLWKSNIPVSSVKHFSKIFKPKEEVMTDY